MSACHISLSSLPYLAKNVHSWWKFDNLHNFLRHGIYTVWVQKIPPWGLVAIFLKRLGIFQPNFTCLLRVPIHARLRISIQLSATLTKLCYIKRDHPVHIMCATCPPSAKTHAGIFWHISETGIFSPNFTRLFSIVSNCDEVMPY